MAKCECGCTHPWLIRRVSDYPAAIQDTLLTSTATSAYVCYPCVKRKGAAGIRWPTRNDWACATGQVQDPKLKDKNSVVSRTVTYMGALKAYKFKVGDKFHLDGIRDRIYSFTNQFKVCKRPSVGVRSRACYCPSCHRGEFSSCESPGSCAFISVPEASKSVRDDKRQCFTCKAKGHTWRNCPRDIEVSSDDSGASDSDAPLASDCSDDEH